MKRFFYIILSLLFVTFITGFFTTNDEGVKYDPPKPEDAPEEIRKAVLYGYEILTNTKKNLPDMWAMN